MWNRPIVRTCLAVAAVLAVASWVRPAAALDGYQAREHVFGGISAGGGYGFVNQNGTLLEEGPGMHLQGMLGGGLSDRFLLAVELDWWSRSVDLGSSNRFVFHHGSVGGVANYFAVGGFYLKGGAGFAYGVCAGTREDDNCRWQELGLSTEGGVGYEFWFNGTLAGNTELSYTHHFYSHSAFDTASLTFGLRWY